MSNNSAIILNAIIQSQKENAFPSETLEYFFNIFSSEQILKDYSLEYDEIESGIVDAPYDGGIDPIYMFINGELVAEDTDASTFKKNVHIELHILQNKTTKSFNESSILKIHSCISDLFNLSEDITQKSEYNDQLINLASISRDIFIKLAPRFPKITINIHYVCLESDGYVHQNVRKKSVLVTKTVEKFFTNPDTNFIFWGAPELLDAARRNPDSEKTLKTTKSISAKDSYIALCDLHEYNKFLRREDKSVDTNLFDANVRAFQGHTEVNREINHTLLNDADTQFWWMNNGITILASNATQNGDYLTIQNPKIVNGLQTSTQISLYFDSLGKNADEISERQILVKIVSSEDGQTRDKIIKATNRQNSIQSYSLRATDKIQADIEYELLQNDLYYDRRKGYYKNDGRPATKIISISLMAQCVMASLLCRPNDARARPSSLIKDDKEYEKDFSRNIQ